MKRAGVRALAALALAVGVLPGFICGESPRVLAPELRHVAKLPLTDDSIRFAVIGDTGSGAAPQYQVGERMNEVHQAFPFDFVIMLGDNLYGLERPVDYANKFEKPYAKLLDAGVEFFAALGNHDNPNQRYYEPFHMDGKRYYSFEKGDVKFLALDSNYMDEEQLAWIQKELDGTKQPWRIAFFHHPIYSSGAFHGSEIDLRERLEPLFVKYGVRVVFSGHEHFYERIKPQKGVYYFIAGGSARLRRNNIMQSAITAKGFDTDNSFMLVEISGDTMFFETLARTGELVEAGEVARQDVTEPEIEVPAPEKPGPKQDASAGAKTAPPPP
jgi:predicted phosphodiesterase